MKLMLAVSVLFLVGSAQAQAGGKPAAADDSDLKSAEQQWVEAYYKGDGKTLAGFETDDFTVIANGQKETKEEQIAEVERRGPAGVPASNTEEEIRHYWDVALITGLSGGANVTYTTVWVKQNGQWKVVHLHYSMAG
jgi:ketosteroid isomerase-like protein